MYGTEGGEGGKRFFFFWMGVLNFFGGKSGEDGKNFLRQEEDANVFRLIKKD